MAAIWGAGSLNGMDWSQVRVAAPVLALMLAADPRSPAAACRPSSSATTRRSPPASASPAPACCCCSDRSAWRRRHGPRRSDRLRRPVRAAGGPPAHARAGVQVLPSAAMGAALLLACDIVALHAFARDPAGRTGHSGPGRRLPDLAAGRAVQEGDPMTHALSAADLDDAATTTARSATDLDARHPRRGVRRDRRAQRLRQVDAAAGPLPAAQPSAGQVLLDGEDIQRCPPKEVARRLGLLPQTSLAPDGITRRRSRRARPVPAPVGCSRQWSPRRRGRGRRGVAATEVTELAGRLVDELSGGQRQRVWVAMVLAQQTPTAAARRADHVPRHRPSDRAAGTVRGAQPEQGHTIVAVLHDLNHAARYATHIIAMRDGAIVAAGAPAEVITDRARRGRSSTCPAGSSSDPVTGTPLVLPLGGHQPALA